MKQSINNLPYIQILLIALCIVCGIISFAAVAPKMQDPAAYPKTVASLDAKRETVLEMSASLIGISVAVAAVPGDATTPVANEISNLNSYLIIVLGAIMLEKFLLPIIAFVVWRILMPFAFLAFGLFFLFGKPGFLRTGLCIGILGILLTFLIPTGVMIGDVIDKSYGTKDVLETVKTDVKDITDTLTKSTEKKTKKSTENSSGTKKSKSIIDKIGKIGDALSDLEANVSENFSELGDTLSDTAKNVLEKVKTTIGDLMDIIAVLLITSCVIPIGTLFLLIAIVKFTFRVLMKKIGLEG